MDNKIILKTVPEYRLKKIEIKRGDAIDQIKFVYDDETTWCYGWSDGGKEDNRPVILVKGEFLTRVTHETLHNFRYAAAGVEFETNKGRIFSYQPLGMSTNWKSEQTTICALPGKEIIGLKIKHGVLIGTEQQQNADSFSSSHEFNVDSSSPNNNTGKSLYWYCIAVKYAKEDSISHEEVFDDHFLGQDDSIRFHHFDNWDDANRMWKRIKEECNLKMGRSGVLLDCQKLAKLKQTGSNIEGIKDCLEKAKENGYYAEKKDEEVNLVDTILTLYKLLSTKEDLFMMLWVIFLLSVSFYLDLESQLLTGQVMGILPTIFLTKDNKETYNQTGINQVEENWYAQKVCNYIIDCEGQSEDSKVIDHCKALILGFVFLRVTERLFYVVNVWFHHNACDRKNKIMRMRAFQHVLSLDQAYFDNHSASAIRGSMNAHSINNLITWNIPYLVTLNLQFFMTAIYMLRIDYRLGGLAILGFTLIKYGLLKPCEHIEHQIHKIENKLGTTNNQILSETFDMITSVKLFSTESHHLKDFQMNIERSLKNLKFIVFLRCFREFTNGVLQVCIFGGVLYYGLTVMNSNSSGVGDLPAFFLLIRSFRELFGRIKWHHEVLVREFADIERFIHLMNSKTSLINGTEKIKNANTIGDIEFNNVWFEYPTRPGEEILKGLNLKISAHKITAIVGDSGAGKSTITKLLMRLYDPKQGKITINGKDIRNFDLKELHDYIGIVNQNPDLFNAPLTDNIGYGRNCNQKEIEKASDIANCTGFIKKFRGKFDTFAGSRGSNLSGGQKQRIAIARAAIIDPQVLILDEATSSLDAENEVLVQKALENVMKNRTILIIAHRLSTVKNADNIICMKNGEVVEQGTHEFLMSQRGTYFNLVNNQIIDENKNCKSQST